MLLREIRSIYRAELDSIYPKEEVDGIFNRVIEHYLGLQGFILAFQPQYVLSKEEEQPLFEALAELKKEIPVQYVLGRTFFMDLPLLVDSSVLIPRPETEELVAWILSDLGAMEENYSILDVGTGSGNIAIALKRNKPFVEVHALDHSSDALELAERNAALNEVEIHWFKHDIREQLPMELQVDLLVSNPPYVLESEKEAMHPNVKSNEPATALFVSDADPLVYYRHILEACKDIISSEGWVYFEINEGKGPDMEALFQNYGYSEIQLKKDIFGKDRMIRAKAPKH